MPFCPQCGFSNADDAMVCAQCGRNLRPATSAPPLQTTGVVMPPGGAAVPNYLVYAILTTVVCCPATGIPAIIYASQVNTKLQLGDVAGAQTASNNAKMWCWISLALGLITLVGYGLLLVIGIYGRLHSR
jgi:Interferon-induced transmembrane protein/zinc-ribbon domain